MSRWIAVADGRPKPGEHVLVYSSDTVPQPAYRDGAQWVSCLPERLVVVGVTHWMTMPEPPKL